MKLTADLVGAKLAPVHTSWTARDCALYAVGIGAGQEDPLRELEFTIGSAPYRQQVVYPTFGVLAGARVGVEGLIELLGDAVDVRKMLHGGQKCEQLAPLPTAASVIADARISALWDKGSATVAETVSEVSDADSGELYTRTTQALFFRGVGGWGGERGPSTSVAPKENAPDRVLTTSTRADQALLYRFSGDSNPLHLDPDVARAAGFSRPILHGLCAYGVVGRALLAAYVDADPARFGSLSARFSSPTMPGDVLRIETWEDGGSVSFVVKRDNGDILLSHGEFTFDHER